MATRGHETRIPIPEQGIHPEVHPDNLGFGGLSDAQNMIFRDSRFQSREGIALLSGDVQHPYNLLTDEMSNPTANWADDFDYTPGWDPGFPMPPVNPVTAAHWVVGWPGYEAGLFGNTGLNVHASNEQQVPIADTSTVTGVNANGLWTDYVAISGGRTHSVVIWMQSPAGWELRQPNVYVEIFDANDQRLEYHELPRATSPGLIHARYLTFTAHADAAKAKISFRVNSVNPATYTTEFDIFGMTLVEGARPDYWTRGQVAAPANVNLMAAASACPETENDVENGFFEMDQTPDQRRLVPASQINGSLNGSSIGLSFCGANLLYFTNAGGIASLHTTYENCPVSAGAKYTVEIYSFENETLVAQGSFSIAYYDTGGSYIGGSSGAWNEERSIDGLRRQWKVITTPALTAYLSVRYLFGSGLNNDLWLAAIKVYEGDAGSGPPDDWSPPPADITGPHANDERVMGFYQYDYLAGAARSENVILAGTDKGWWQYNIGTSQWDDITPSTDPLNGGDEHVIFRAYDHDQKTYILGCNGATAQSEKICKYNGTGTYEVIDEAPKAKCIAVAGTRLIAGNCVSGSDYYPTAVFYSKTILDGHFDTWGAGDIIRLADTAGEIVAMEEMGNLMVAVYKTDSIYILAVQSGIYPFRPDLRATGISGPVSPAAVTALNNNSHAYLGRDAQVYLFDGSQPRALGPHIQTYLRNTFDLDHGAKAFLAWDKYHQELWVVYPAKGTFGAIRRALVIQMRNGFPAWPMVWRSDFNFSAGISFVLESAIRMGDILDPMGDITSAMGDLKTAQRVVLLGGIDGEIYYLNGVKDLEEAIRCRYTFGISDFGVHREVTIKEIEHYFQRTNLSQDVTFSLIPIKSGETPSTVLTRQDKSFDISEDQPYITEHRYTSPKFNCEYSISANNKIDASGADIAFAVRGRR